MSNAAHSPVHHRSLREYVEALRSIGELQEIDQQVDWNLEIGAITRRVYETGGPAVLFNRIEGIEPGFRVLGAPAGVSARPGQPMARVATSIGLPPTATRSRSSRLWRKPTIFRGSRQNA